ncbi:MAG: ribonucleotide-diphosphate reductase subunit beta [Rickettsiales bacterium]|nr:ribonucleotide-diphosphate reductase subunit beta [Rickettsiales bacterium]|tara:strand:- start:5064 stop:6032 length:969 start_codon:yes stop_codon:yes gene_type:complete
MSLFKERIPYKPFEYPEYYNDGWLKQAQAFWLHTEIPMQGDVKDWNEKLTKSEKNLVGNILLGFAQTECAVSDYWTQKVVGWFPKHEIKQMAMMFGSQETIHAVAYSYLNETLGLENFEAFLQDEATMERFDNLVAYEGTELGGIAKSLAIFSAFAEGVSLYSAFAVLYSFQLRNLLKGIGQQMKWSVRDESLHSKMGCQLFKHMCAEVPELRNKCYKDVIEAAEAMLSAEEKYIDRMFEQGDIENLKAYDLKQFIRKRLNEKIVELGYSNRGKHFKYDEVASANLDWFYHLTGGHTHTDFFAVRPTDYSKANEGEDFQDIW